MMAADLERLRSLALEVGCIAPGPWEAGREDRRENPAMVYCDDATGQRVADCSGKFLFWTEEQRRTLALFIATAQPRVILDLIERVGAAEAKCTMGVGSGKGQLFVHGDYDSIKAAQEIVLDNARLRALLFEAKEVLAPFGCDCKGTCDDDELRIVKPSECRRHDAREVASQIEEALK